MVPGYLATVWFLPTKNGPVRFWNRQTTGRPHDKRVVTQTGPKTDRVFARLHRSTIWVIHILLQLSISVLIILQHDIQVKYTVLGSLSPWGIRFTIASKIRGVAVEYKQINPKITGFPQLLHGY
jgi:hypothetical protein